MDVVTLTDPASEVAAQFVPSAGMIGTSLTDAGAQLLGQRFQKATRRLGFNARKVEFATDLFRPPAAPGQGSLF